MSDSDSYEVTHDQKGNAIPQADAAPAERPERIGRYRIQRVLGSGGFGLVYLAHDEQLDRPVAVKVPHARLVSNPQDADAYLAEARILANLDHAHIVPVHDVGRTEEFPCYLVSKYVEGTDLARRLKQHRLSCNESAELVATVAEALHYAHKRGLVHRDVKPGNILLDTDGKPYVVDFGLALREVDVGTGPKYAGTPAYMSPEQARGEGHRVDGRSDVFSLGVVFYELLTGRRPFRGDTQAELLERVSTFEPKPVRQLDDAIPAELERICLKALSKRASERYTTARDVADDLRQFLAEHCGSQSSPTGSVPGTNFGVTPVSTASSNSETSAASETAASLDSQPIKIVPKGLLSFDEHDADFFLELLPGPRDRNGLPDSLRFWKTRIEETDPDNTFSVGLIYGPSGCGKSSLVKAGLLPRLSEDVITVYIEASPDGTETRLLNGLLKRVPASLDNPTLKDTLTALRRGRGIAAGKKLLIVLDQFEQWLHAKREQANTELVQALRQCDGGRVQCLVMVRDDFWLAVSRFLRELEIRLVEGRNSALADLFDLRHTRKVLAAFGRAFGALPQNGKDTTREQKDFLKQSVSGLTEEGKVICVRLALFAEMVKGKPWTPATLKEVGGTKGVGATFLEETFSASTAPPEHRYHQTAARAVLRALLPESGTDIKGQMKSHNELLEVSGYARRPQDFDDLMRILDSEIRLITPTDPAGVESDDDFITRPDTGHKYYQLAHDYLVHSLRDWLTRKQRETRRGRAELRLRDRAALWSVKPERRHLPSAWEYVNIRLLTDRSNWAEAQRKMMSSAGRVHGLRWGGVLAAALVIAVTIQQLVAASRHRNFTEQIQTAVASMCNVGGPGVPYALRELEDLPREMVVKELSGRFADSKDSQKLPLAYALAHFGKLKVDFLVEQIQGAPAGEVDNLIAALGHTKQAALKSLAASAGNQSEQELRYKSRLSIVALHLGDLTLARDMCQLRPDPIERTLFIETLPNWHGDAARLAKLAASINDGPLRSGIALGVGGIAVDQVPVDAKLAWQRVFSDWSQNKPDSGTHSAAGWAGRRWELDLPELAQTTRPVNEMDWHVDTLGLTMLKIPAGRFTRTDSRDRNAIQQTVTLTQPFLLADRETSRGLFQQFIDDDAWPAEEKPTNWSGADADTSPTAAGPVQQVSWYDAVLFCNWLSSQQGLTPCYERTGGTEKIRTEEHAAWRAVQGSNGYRLPTEAEWEFACRAGSVTDFAHGDDESLLDRYAVFRARRTLACGSKLPNAWGLFDVHGNVFEWCQDGSHDYGAEGAVSDPKEPPQGQRRVLRGGSFTYFERNARSGERNVNFPNYRYLHLGFRVARTYH